MLAEFQNMHASRWKNEETGDRRVNFFLSVTAAVVAASVALAAKSFGDMSASILLVFLLGVVGVLLFGVFTLLRLVRRNKVTDKYDIAQDKIRAYFLAQDIQIEQYVEFQPKGKYDPFVNSKQRKFRLKRGGLVETVALLNSVIVTLLVAVGSVSSNLDAWMSMAAIVVGVLVFWIQKVAVDKLYRSDSDDE